MKVGKVAVKLTAKGEKETHLDPKAVYHVTDDPESFKSGHFERASSADAAEAKSSKSSKGAK